ncbi:MAG: hypothetical protein E7408_03225 [Ruminococcaceae bacterium]|nr:hypothetical protein [Oscillospiraceae bacterium]
MDRIIEVKVFGNHLTKDSKNAGTRGEANVTKLRISFDEGWDGYAKDIVFWDAYGENAVRIMLTENLMESIGMYLVPIPAEAMARAGMLTFTIKGAADDKIQASVTGKLEVKDSPDILEPIPPTPTEIQQMQTQVEDVLDKIVDAAEATKAIKNMSVSAETVFSGEEAFVVNKTEEDGAFKLHFGIPEGKKGVGVSRAYVHGGELYVSFTDGSVHKAGMVKGDKGDAGPKGDTGGKGNTGDSGVHIGTEAPTDQEKNVWIDTTEMTELSDVQKILDILEYTDEGVSVDLSGYAKSSETPTYIEITTATPISEIFSCHYFILQVGENDDCIRYITNKNRPLAGVDYNAEAYVVEASSGIIDTYRVYFGPSANGCRISGWHETCDINNGDPRTDALTFNKIIGVKLPL